MDSFNKNIIRQLASYLLMLLLWIGLFTACKTEYEAVPFNHIERFTIKDAKGETLQASIVEDRIVIYIPPHQDIPESITPEIVLAEHAKCKPASGEKVDISNNQEVEYVVTAQDGKIRRFNLEMVLNQPNISFSGLNHSFYLRVPYGRAGGTVEHLIANSKYTKVFLVDSNGQENELQLDESRLSINSFTALLPITTKPGKCRLWVRSGIRSMISPEFNVLPPDKIYMLVNPKTGQERVDVKRGAKVAFFYSTWGIETYLKVRAHSFELVDFNSVSHKVTAEFNADKTEMEIEVPKEVVSGKLKSLLGFDESGKKVFEYEIHRYTVID